MPKAVGIKAANLGGLVEKREAMTSRKYRRLRLKANRKAAKAKKLSNNPIIYI